MSESARTSATDRDVTISGGSGGILKPPAKETRSVSRQIKEAELEVLHNRLIQKERILQEQTEMLRDQREAFAREQENAQRDLDTIKSGLETREAELSRRDESRTEAERPDDKGGNIDELTRMIVNLSMEMNQIKTAMNRDPPTANNPQYLDANTSAYLPPARPHTYFDSPPPRVNFRDALDSVPLFDGQNVPLAQFTRACRRARETFPSASEFDLTRLLLNKLRGRAYYAVEDEPCDSVTQLIDLLNCAFGASRTIDQYRGELSSIFIKHNEHTLDYIARVKDLRTSILDAERRERGTLTDDAIREIDALTARAFCDGLPLEFRLQLNQSHYNLPFEAFSHVKIIAKRRELDRERYESSRGGFREQAHYDLHPVGRPLAHSSPYRGGINNRHTREPGRPAAPNFERNPARRYDSARSDIYPRPRPPMNYYREEPSRNTRYPAEGPPRRPASTPLNERRPPVCRYCQNIGHTIEECRKRRYNEGISNSGNANRPSRPADEPRAGTSQGNERPVKVVQTGEIQPASQS